MTDGDLGRLMEFYTKGKAANGFEGGIQLAVQRILASPKFVWRVERDPETVAAGTALPPERLRAGRRASPSSSGVRSRTTSCSILAKQGRLKNKVVLTQQVQRMLRDAKVERFVTTFAGQWLYLRT